MSTTKKNNKSMMLLFGAVFLLPVILAKLALDNDWFNQAATNKGQLLSPPVDMSVLYTAVQQQPKWKFLYVLPEVCTAECENALYSIAQVHSALGKESDRAEVVVITHEKSNVSQLVLLKKKQNIHLINTNLKSLQQVFKDNNTDGIFIADTLNNVILRYPLHIDKEQAVLHSRDILSDMRKVLKLSRIG